MAVDQYAHAHSAPSTRLHRTRKSENRPNREISTMMSRRPGANLAFALGLALFVSTTRAELPIQDNCELNHAVNMSELSLCGKRDWAEVIVASSRKCSFEKYQFLLGVYDCDSGKAVPKFFKRMPARASSLLDGASAAGGKPGFLTLAGFREYGKAAARGVVDVEVRVRLAPTERPCACAHPFTSSCTSPALTPRSPHSFRGHSRFWSPAVCLSGVGGLLQKERRARPL
jgi:hypothetical protein